MRVAALAVALLLTCTPIVASDRSVRASARASSATDAPRLAEPVATLSDRSVRASARATSAARATDEPARFAAGGLPAQPPTVVGWEQAYVDLRVDETGAVDTVKILQTTPGFDDRVGPALSGWRFKPAMHDGEAVPADIFVALIYRPPVLYNTPTIGNPPETRAAPEPDAPYPTATEIPPYPVQATGDGQVLVEVDVDETGAVTRATVVSPPTGFDDAARDAAGRWHFRAAQNRGRPTTAIAYLAFGFRQPTSAPAAIHP
jgi:TonB family protein